jgi:predicted DCC family thiol-disulfide oxidoreductase YuxK
MNPTSQPIILYDGMCGLCDRFVQFVVKRDSLAKIKFAALQSEIAKGLLRKFGLPEEAISFVILIEGDKNYVKSAAVLRTLNYLDGAWKFFTFLRLIPPPMANLVYDFIARHRYKWFGKFEECIIPTAETRSRFLL